MSSELVAAVVIGAVIGGIIGGVIGVVAARVLHRRSPCGDGTDDTDG